MVLINGNGVSIGYIVVNYFGLVIWGEYVDLFFGYFCSENIVFVIEYDVVRCNNFFIFWVDGFDDVIIYVNCVDLVV